MIFLSCVHTVSVIISSTVKGSPSHKSLLNSLYKQAKYELDYYLRRDSLCRFDATTSNDVTNFMKNLAIDFCQMTWCENDGTASLIDLLKLKIQTKKLHWSSLDANGFSSDLLFQSWVTSKKKKKALVCTFFSFQQRFSPFFAGNYVFKLHVYFLLFKKKYIISESILSSSRKYLSTWFSLKLVAKFPDAVFKDILRGCFVITVIFLLFYMGFKQYEISINRSWGITALYSRLVLDYFFRLT